MPLRVIAGDLGRRRLHAPAGLATRPSSGRLRQSLFDILGSSLRGQVFVDVYAGSGAVGIEAYSRGARPVVWIESRAPAARALRANLARLQLAEGTVVLERAAGAALAALARLPAVQSAGGCGYVFLDPPYAAGGELARLLTALGARPGLLHRGSRVIAETRRGAALPERCGRLMRERVHRLGDSQLSFYQIAGNGAGE